jgi:hypothetical protein
VTIHFDVIVDIGAHFLPLEVGVQIAERWVIAALRHRRFYSVAELNDAITELRDRINNRSLGTPSKNSKARTWQSTQFHRFWFRVAWMKV